jgi:membrane-associated phospholipid phosphatase
MSPEESDITVSRRQRAAKVISDFTSPPILALPTFVILAQYDQSHQNLSLFQALAELVISITCGVTLPIVFVLLLMSRNLVSSVHIPVRQQRTAPYLITIALYLAGVGLDYWIAGGTSLAALMFCYWFNGVVTLFINFFWKISAHALGVSAPLAILTFLFGWWMLPFYVLIPVVGWARVYIKAHTLGQVIAGFGFGLSSTALWLILVFRPFGWL